MHEVALADAVVRAAERAARGHEARRVLTATLELGELTCVDFEALQFAFELASKGTIVEGCALLLERRELRVRCPTCSWSGRLEAQRRSCPTCHEGSLQVESGRQMRLLSINVEDADA